MSRVTITNGKVRNDISSTGFQVEYGVKLHATDTLLEEVLEGGEKTLAALDIAFLTVGSGSRKFPETNFAFNPTNQNHFLVFERLATGKVTATIKEKANNGSFAIVQPVRSVTFS
jgi:hypothetical protein